jgi:Pentapeptide repeats (8 copies)
MTAHRKLRWVALGAVAGVVATWGGFGLVDAAPTAPTIVTTCTKVKNAKTKIIAASAVVACTKKGKGIAKTWDSRHQVLFRWLKSHSGFGDFSGIDLSGAELFFTNPAPGNFSGANFTIANAAGANFQFSNLSGADFSFASLQGANLAFTNLTNAKLHLTLMEGANLNGVTLVGADLTGAKLLGSTFTGATVTNNNWLGATCPDGFVVVAQFGNCFGHGV